MCTPFLQNKAVRGDNAYLWLSKISCRKGLVSSLIFIFSQVEKEVNLQSFPETGEKPEEGIMRKASKDCGEGRPLSAGEQAKPQ